MLLIGDRKGIRSTPRDTVMVVNTSGQGTAQTSPKYPAGMKSFGLSSDAHDKDDCRIRNQGGNWL